ncbi:Na+/H+ antiporter NhaC family protein [Helicobacter sp. 23-1045]
MSLLVPVVVIALVFITRKVALSLLCGIALGGILLFYNSPFEILPYIYKNIAGVFYTSENGAISANLDSIYIFGFLIILGILSQLILYSGAVNAFVAWAHKRISSPQGSEFIAFVAGIVIFIDDYFNALTVGQISKSLNDANKSSRERLAYIIDSTSAPICILMPISSWGAYILGVMDKNVPKDFGDSFVLLMQSIWSNYYAWFALVAVFFTILWQVNLRAMQKNVNVGVKELRESHAHRATSSVWLLVVPILMLMVAIFAMIFYSGWRASNSQNLMDILANTSTAFSLFFGGLFTLIVSFFISRKQLKVAYYAPIIRAGFLGMLPAILILVLAWGIGPVIRDDMQTGVYLASVGRDFFNSNAVVFTPAILFCIAAFIAFATGTSWGTFAILIPIGVEVISANGGGSVDSALCISAILAGAVFGDHSSPISDTTILSATGAECSVQSHFITQLPYVCAVAIIALISFVVAGFWGVFVGYVIGFALLIGFLYFCKVAVSKPLEI